MNHHFRAAALITIFAAELGVADNFGMDNPTAGKMVMDNDYDSIQGTWVCIGVEEDGRKDTLRRDKLVGVRWTYERDLMWIKSRKDAEAKFILDQAKSLRTQTLIYDRGTGYRQHSLYELRGDQMRWCVSEDQLPPVFDSKDGRVIITLKHEKKAEK
jgi:uncharacterized protein (TIGR03067 family)